MARKNVFYSFPGEIEMTGVWIAVSCFGLLLIGWDRWQGNWGSLLPRNLLGNAAFNRYI